MKTFYALVLWVLLSLAAQFELSAQTPSPDQLVFIDGGENLLAAAESVNGLELSSDGKSVVLQESALDGELVLQTQTLEYKFDQGLASWNGRAPHNATSGFMVLMRVDYQGEWSPWLTMGYWHKYFWSSYGATDFAGGEVNVDMLDLNYVASEIQFKIVFKRSSPNLASAELRRVSFFASDSKRTVSLYALGLEKPAAVFIPTEHVYQMEVDPVIGPSICSPSTTAMIVRSYQRSVNVLRFAEDTYDAYWSMFGVWPRAVQHASEYGLSGWVGRYRSWEEAAEVLRNGGRVAMSIGKPLYTGHLVMLAGFDAAGNPIVHDPAKRDGYAKVYAKADITEAWFGKGGYAYTFYGPDEAETLVVETPYAPVVLRCLGNPFKQVAQFELSIPNTENVQIAIYDLMGRRLSLLHQGNLQAGEHILKWNSTDLPTGMYKLVYRSATRSQHLSVVKH